MRNITPFGSEKVIDEKINQPGLRTYLVGFDIANDGSYKYDWKRLINTLQKVIPEFALGMREGGKVDQNEITSILSQAAKSIYKIKEFEEVKSIYLENESCIEDDEIEKKYLRRGEFGELLLHLLLRDFHNTIPLLSKIYFKDSYGVTVHGFDAVHIEPSTKTLWLGESKLYIDGKKGVEALLQDIHDHFNSNYLEEEFTIISKKLNLLDNIPERDHWLELMDSNNKLKDVFKHINVPLVCTYSSDLFSKFDDELDPDFIAEYEKEVLALKNYFDQNNKHAWTSHLNIILLLFPVKCKKELVKRMHKKLHLLQVIEDE